MAIFVKKKILSNKLHFRNSIIILIMLGVLFFLTGFLTNYFILRKDNLSRAKMQIEKNLHPIEKEVIKNLNDDIIQKNIRNLYDLKASLHKLSQKTNKYYFVLYENNIPTFWTSNLMVPGNPERYNDSTINFYRLENGYHEIISKRLSDSLVLLGIIPIYNKFEINNKYFKDGFLFKNPILKNVIIDNQNNKSKKANIHDFKGRQLFSINYTTSSIPTSTKVGNYLQVAGFLFFFYVVNLLVQYYTFKRRKLYIAIALIVSVFLVTELLVKKTGYFFNNFSGEIFQPNIFASTIYGNSLGALLLRLFMVFWILMHISSWLSIKSVQEKLNYKNSSVLTFLSAVFLMLIYQLTIGITRSLVLDSIISFDFYNFVKLDKYSFFGLLAFGMLALILLLATKVIVKLSYGKFFAASHIIVIIGTFFIFQQVEVYHSKLHILTFLLLYLVFLIIIIIEFKLLDTQTKFIFLKNLLVLSFLSAIISYVVISYSNEKELEKLKFELKAIDSQRDMAEEFFFLQSGEEIKNDNFIKNYFKKPYLTDLEIEKKIILEYFNSYTNKYDYVVHSFNKDKGSLKGINEKSFEELEEILNNPDKEELSVNYNYFPVEKKGRKYLGFFEFKEKDATIGYLFIEIFPKFFGYNSIYPELLNSGAENDKLDFETKSFAMYNKGMLISQLGDYEYNSYFNFPFPKNKEFNLVKTANYTHLIYKKENKYLIISQQKTSVFNPISTFSFILFFVFLFMLSVELAGFKRSILGLMESERKLFTRSLQNKIQRSMIGLVIFSLIIVGIVTLYFFQNQYNNYHNNKLFKKIESLTTDLKYQYADYQDSTNYFQNTIAENIKKLTDVHALDMNVYDKQGNLIISSQLDIFKRGLISGKMEPTAFYNLVYLNKSKYFQDENIGKLKFLSAYQPFKDEKGNLLAYLNFPYYGREKSLRADISYFLVAIVNVYVFMILASAILAILLSRSITESLTIITDNIRQIQLGKRNIPIKWESRDEIGLLVKEYNRMIQELEYSADLLARSERESAWREMAKQVAHEIKNPLTPMKLSIQHLQRALAEKRPDVNELTQKVTVGLIEQINTLTDIASAFSDFAKMPAENYERVNLQEIIESTSEIFDDPDKLTLELSLSKETCFVKADKNQLIRVLNNIVKNAVQSISEDQEGHIKIGLKYGDAFHTVSVSDNGSGIAIDKIDKVFEPNFTTKSSGTGLGLAISKNIIEKTGGNIWFESNETSGTTFYINLPNFIY